MAEVASKTLTAEAPTYETIMELDRKVREFPIPADAAAFQEDLETPPDSEPPPLQESMIRFVLSHSREVSEYHGLPLLIYPYMANRFSKSFFTSTVASLRKPSLIVQEIR